jgi:hypothetical protein
MKNTIFGRKREIIAASVMLAPVAFLYLSKRRVRIQKAKKEYYLNKMMKRKFISDELELKPRKIRLSELKTLLNQQQ